PGVIGGDCEGLVAAQSSTEVGRIDKSGVDHERAVTVVRRAQSEAVDAIALKKEAAFHRSAPAANPLIASGAGVRERAELRSDQEVPACAERKALRSFVGEPDVRGVGAGLEAELILHLSAC